RDSNLLLSNELIELLKVRRRFRVVGPAIGRLKLPQQHVPFVPSPTPASVDDNGSSIFQHAQVTRRLADQPSRLDPANVGGLLQLPCQFPQILFILVPP